MREGFTTGSCAAAAAKAAAYMLLCGVQIDTVDITVPRGDRFEAELLDIVRNDDEVSCAVKKDGGDDPDVTTGLLIYATARYPENTKKGNRRHDDTISVPGNEATVTIYGGEGIGKVTKPGLDQPVGEWAINTVPRKMITDAVRDACELAGYEGGVNITISAPEGEEIAKRTFNPRLGIEGGISIIGTSGIVEPMSDKALKDTIYVELKQRRALGYTGVVISPGNYGRQFLLEHYGYDIDKAVKCSNFIGETIDMCVSLGFSDVILAGHIGKLVKVASGIMNTHSHEADGRMETIAAAGIRAGLPNEVLNKILDSLSTIEALQTVRKYDEDKQGKNSLNNVMSTIISRIKYYLDFRAAGKINIEATTYCGEIALVSETDHMREMLKRIEERQGN